MTPWAELIPHPPGAPAFLRAPHHGDACRAPDCGEQLVAGEVCYAVTEVPSTNALPGRSEAWVCWRHIRPDDGPVTV